MCDSLWSVIEYVRKWMTESLFVPKTIIWILRDVWMREWNSYFRVPRQTKFCRCLVITIIHSNCFYSLHWFRPFDFEFSSVLLKAASNMKMFAIHSKTISHDNIRINVGRIRGILLLCGTWTLVQIKLFGVIGWFGWMNVITKEKKVSTSSALQVFGEYTRSTW